MHTTEMINKWFYYTISRVREQRVPEKWQGVGIFKIVLRRDAMVTRIWTPKRYQRSCFSTGMGNVILRNVWEILSCPQNLLKCNKILVHPAQFTCVVISCVLRAAPQITAKSPPNAPETQEITTTQVSQAGWTILLHFSTFWGQFKISHTFLYMMFPIVWAICGFSQSNKIMATRIIFQRLVLQKKNVHVTYPTLGIWFIELVSHLLFSMC